MAGKAELSTSPAAMTTKLQVCPEEGEGTEHHRSHKETLKWNHLLLMETLDPQLFMDMLDPFLRSQIHERMTKEEKTRQLLQNLSRGPVEMFDRFCKIIAGLNPDIFQKLRGTEPTREESDFFVKSFYKDLSAGIINAGSKTDNDIDKRIDLDTEFINLKLTDRQFDYTNNPDILNKEDESEGSDTDEECNESLGHQLGAQKVVDEDIDMADILPADFAGKSVLLQGRAGVGKSTLTQYVAREWAKGRWGTAFTGVFLLNMRKLVHVRQEMSLSQLLGMYAEYVTGAPDPDKPSIEWLKQNADKVLIFADGIDELPELGKLLKRTPNLKALTIKATPLDWCLNLIQKSVLPECTTVVVSRPFIGLRKLKYDREIEVFGLTPDMVMQFVDRNVESGKKAYVKEALSKNPVLLSVCTITFYCAAICKILAKDPSLDGASLITYTRITAYIIMQFVSRNAAEECTLSVIPEEFSECLGEMAALAYHGLLAGGQDNTRLVFDHTDFNQVGFLNNKMKAAKQTGLLLYKDVVTPSSPQLQAEFVHLSIQEFLAMASLAKAGEDKVREFFKSSLGRFNMSKLFAFGLFLDKDSIDITAIRLAATRGEENQNTTKGNDEIQSILVDIFQEMCKELQQDDTSWLNMMHIAYESQQPELAMAIGKAVSTAGEFELTHRNLTLIDLKAIFFCLSHSKVHKVICSHILVDHVLGKGISGFLKESSAKISLEFKDTKITDEGMANLAEGIKSSETIDCLQYLGNDITDTGMKWLSEGIARTTSLSSLAFLFSEVTEEGFKHLSDGIKSAKSLKHLRLGNTQISDIGMGHLADGIKESKSLATVCLQAVVYTASSIQCLCGAMASETSPRQLQLEDYVMNYEEIKKLSNACNKVRQLKHLVFNNCDFMKRTDSMKPLTDGIRNIAVLHFRRVTFSAEAIGHISEAISGLPFLDRLIIEECDFKNNTIDTVFKEIASSGIKHLEWRPMS